jgi:hypothetical protein
MAVTSSLDLGLAPCTIMLIAGDCDHAERSTENISIKVAVAARKSSPRD